MDAANKNATLNVHAKTLNECLWMIYRSVLGEGNPAFPRGKEVREWPHPVVLHLEENRHPWTLIPGRKLNPYFAIAEVIWILAGREDVEFIEFYNKNMKTFSDDGKSFYGAYGNRIRNFPEYVPYCVTQPEGDASERYIPTDLFEKDFLDQIHLVVRRLREDKDTRQAVIGLWDPARDLKDGHKDYPCNNLCYFSQRSGKLSMSVIRRSNDMVWGLPYNQIQFYFLQALMAGELRAEIGTYHEFVQNMHVYLNEYPETLVHIGKEIWEERATFSSGTHRKWDSTRNSPGWVKSILTVDPPFPGVDRRINLTQFDSFCQIFFPFENACRNRPASMTFESVASVRAEMMRAHVPDYWTSTMLLVPLAFIARKHGNKTMHDGLFEYVEPHVKWLIEDFTSPKA